MSFFLLFSAIFDVYMLPVPLKTMLSWLNTLPRGSPRALFLSTHHGLAPRTKRQSAKTFSGSWILLEGVPRALRRGRAAHGYLDTFRIPAKVGIQIPDTCLVRYTDTGYHQTSGIRARIRILSADTSHGWRCRGCPVEVSMVQIGPKIE